MFKKSLTIMVVITCLQAAFASVSLSTGAVLPGWEQIYSGSQVNDAKRIIRNYATQLGIACILQDVHMKKNARLISRSVHVDTWFSSRGDLRVLLNERTQHVLLLETTGRSSDHLIVVFQLDSDLLLVAC